MKSILTPVKVLIVLFVISAIWMSAGCKKDNEPVPSYVQTNLVSDTSAIAANRVDPNLGNPWGIAIGPTGAFWISANATGKSVIYDASGNQLLASVSMPLNGSVAAPTGDVFNNTPDFIIPANGQPAKFIFVTEDGVVTAWNGGDTTIVVVDRSAANAVYKGVAICKDGNANFLYAADFRNGKIDVFDGSFNLVNKVFSDPNIPAGFAPFNVVNVNDQLYVTYAKQQAPDNVDDEKGPGNGFVDIFKPNGTLVKRFAAQGTLNSPWGVAVAPAGFYQSGVAILIGNFGDGRINVYDVYGNFKGQMLSNGAPIVIDGLWAIVFAGTNPNGIDPNKLYFTAGPADESEGIFGYLKKR